MTSAAGSWSQSSQGAVQSDSPLLSLESIQRAARTLEGVSVRTPLLELPTISALHGDAVAVKCEHLQPAGAFKIRGAYTALSRLSPEQRASGVITYSSGNHGQAVALAARLMGVRAVVVMPERAPTIKVEGVRGQGAEVVIAGNSSAQRYAQARAMAEEQGLVMVPPFESLDVIAGQATCGLEILEECPHVETILVPVGGGGLIAGVASVVRALKPTVRVVGVEPVGAPKLARALAAGRPVKLDHTESIADGLLPLSIGELPFKILSGLVSESVQVSEDEIADGVRFLHSELHLSIEPSGAATTAALLSGRVRPTGPTVAILSGGNVDPQLFARLVH
jgi:threonine dehydratase